jgi:hypothetical protein
MTAREPARRSATACTRPAGGVTPSSCGWELPAGLRAAGCARDLVRGFLAAAWGPDAGGFADAVVLAASELAANAGVHGAPPIRLSLRLEDRAGRQVLVCAVRDASPRLPRVRGAGLGAERGRGLAVVAGIASAWGVREARGGKDAWFEVPVPAPDPRPAGYVCAKGLT